MVDQTDAPFSQCLLFWASYFDRKSRSELRWKWHTARVVTERIGWCHWGSAHRSWRTQSLKQLQVSVINRVRCLLDTDHRKFLKIVIDKNNNRLIYLVAYKSKQSIFKNRTHALTLRCRLELHSFGKPADTFCMCSLSLKRGCHRSASAVIYKVYICVCGLPRSLVVK